MDAPVAELPDPLLDAVERFLAASGLTPTAFGKASVNDPGFVFGLRAGREPRRETRRRVEAYMREAAA